MKLKIKLVDQTLAKPKYQTKGSVAFDLYARKKTTVKPFSPIIIPLNLVVEVPNGYLLLLAARSSLPLKKSLIVANSVGIIDQDYSGEKDELGLQVLNFSNQKVVVKKGERIAQAILVKIEKAGQFIAVKKMNKKSRGGFGSTG